MKAIDLFCGAGGASLGLQRAGFEVVAAYDHDPKAIRAHHRVPLDEEKLKKEAGDVLWYLAHLCSVMGWSLDDVARLNVEKLKKRYPDGFTAAASVVRADERP